MKTKDYQNGLRDGVAVALGYFAVSFTFGMASAADGLSILQAVLISLTNVTSAGQFSGLAVIAAGGTYIEIALTQLVINLRYCLMSFSLAQKLNRSAPHWHRYLMAYSVTDEIFALDASLDRALPPAYHYGITSAAVPGWVLGTLAGAVSGNILPAFVISALGVAIYGMFLAIIIPPARQNRAVLLVVLSAMGLSFLFSILPVLNRITSGFVIIITTVTVAGIAAWLKPIEDERTE
ncbi:MAG: AzlC family ABC transporter permease [Lachnospiraceae bacterium]|nr:AzlC family ABC transporter permease [Lachnospiraceae bacterium]MDE6939741.1 AzlC family ABC transporter permease [Lachnospiraceae bacterium]MDE6990009.1 AzlC family ABC transporter permease [Lachnospiraceae bacterium]MDE6999747.1 AzlC family ABC transporter permease [Lachnospiraceae bacterium]